MYMGTRRSFKEREVDSEPLALRESSGICFVNQGTRPIAGITPALIIPFDSKDDSKMEMTAMKY